MATRVGDKIAELVYGGGITRSLGHFVNSTKLPAYYITKASR